MLKACIAPLFFLLLVLHALVGYVELGTDSWISKITGSIMDSPQKGLVLFVYTSMLMFILRFVAGPIVHKISPLGLLAISGVLGAIGLTMLGAATSVTACVVAATVYACGKTFLWPTMLAVGSERFPRGGAVAIGLMGGVGMLSAGLLGGPAIGYKQDYYATENLKSSAPETYERYAVSEPKGFLFFPEIKGLDGAKVGVLGDKGKELAAIGVTLQKEGKQDANYDKLNQWWQASQATASQDDQPVKQAGLEGGRMALKITAIVPAIMAVLYTLVLLYFKSIGGYKAIHVDGQH
jgi:hypothetical protein